MIDRLIIKNFKCFEEQEFNFGKLNLLCGANASGKSTTVHALLLLAENTGLVKGQNPFLNRGGLQLGTFREIRCQRINESVIHIDAKRGEISRKLVMEEVKDQGLVIKETVETLQLLLNKNFFYLSAGRVGVVDIHEATDEKLSFGFNGEFVVSFLAKYFQRAIWQEYNYEGDDAKSTLGAQVNYWFKRITGSEVIPSKVDDTNKAKVMFEKSDSGLEDTFSTRSFNTGSGLSYVLAVLVLGLGVGVQSLNSDNEPKIIVIENPEIHLHPRGQVELAKFISFISKTCQVILETHSDHILNGVRICVREKLLNNNDVAIYSFEHISKGVFPEKISLNPDGKPDKWPETFFDEYMKSLAEMI